jgi:hypothetical protein
LNGLLVLGGTTHPAAHSYPTDSWSFPGDANHNTASGTVGDNIVKANATIVVTGYTGVYDAAAHGASGTATGVGGVALSGLSLGASFTNVPGGTASWTFTDVTGNYNNANGTAAIVINKATATVVLSDLTQVFTGSPLTPTATTTPPGLTIGWVGAPDTLTGTYPVTATVNNPNYEGVANGSFVIGAWTTAGFYQPVDMSTTVVVWNTVKGGSTVPLKFNLRAGTTEKTSVSDISSFYQGQVACVGGLEDGVDATLLTTGGTSLRYSGTPGSDGQFVQNWQTPKLPGTCYKVTMTARDGSTINAFFKMK